jgi:hypothetical protein
LLGVALAVAVELAALVAVAAGREVLPAHANSSAPIASATPACARTGGIPRHDHMRMSPGNADTPSLAAFRRNARHGAPRVTFLGG